MSSAKALMGHRGQYILSGLITKASIIALAACKDVSGEALSTEKAGGWRLSATGLAIQGGLKQWPTPTNPMAVAPVH